MDLLLRVTSQVAQKQLETGGRMHFSAILGSNRDVQLLMPKEMKKGVTWDELVAYWKRELVAAVAKSGWRAVSSCIFASDLFMGADESEHPFHIRQALLVHVEHVDGEVAAQDVAYPYQGSPGAKITLGEPNRMAAERWMGGGNQVTHYQQ